MEENKTTERENPPTKSPMREWIESLVVAFLLAMFIRAFFFQAFRIPSGSMIPTLQIGDRLLVNKLRYGPLIPWTQKRIPGFSKPERGDVIVFKFPLDPKRDFIKRLIGMEGDEVEIRLGKIYINGEPLAGEVVMANTYYNYGPYGKAGIKVRVPQGFYFVLGDNSRSSHDSRYWGFVPKEDVVGRAEIIYWPPQRIRFIK